MLTIDEARRSIHLNFDLQEHTDEKGNCFCNRCGRKIVLISAYAFWRVDDDAYREDETDEERDEMPDNVEISEEITAHWCNKCEVITSLSFKSF
jgi:hypothetical protein